MKTLSNKDALAIIHAIIDEAKRISDKTYSIAVAGADGQIIAFATMDGALIASRDIAQAKAHSSVVMGRDTMYWEKKETPIDKGSFCDPMFTTFGGGVIVEDDKYVLGGIGVSGGKSEEDEALAIFGKKYIERSIPRSQQTMG